MTIIVGVEVTIVVCIAMRWSVPAIVMYIIVFVGMRTSEIVVVTAGEPVGVGELAWDICMPTGMRTGMRTTEPNIGMPTGVRIDKRNVGMYTTKCGIGMCITERRVRMTVTERRIGMRIIKCGVVMQPMFVLSLPKKMELTI